MAENALLTMAEHFLPGACGGVSLVVVGHPFDLVKVRLQTGPYRSLPSCLRSIYRPGGLLGFYQGATMPLIGVIPVYASYYGIYKWVKGEFAHSDLATAYGASVAGMATTLASCPAERIKILLQVALPYQKTSIAAVARQVYANGGLSALYRGLSVMLAKEVPSSIVYFCVYERLKATLFRPDSTILAPTVAGGLAGCAAWIATAPLDTIKSIYQSDITADPPTPAKIAREVYRTTGARGFYRGLAPAVVRSFPANAACFLTVEAVNRFFTTKRNKSEDPV